MTIFFLKINERRRSSFKTSPLPLIFLSARAWPPGFVQGGSGHPCFHTKGHGSTLPRRRRHQAAVPAPPANSKHSTSLPVHRLGIKHLDRSITWPPSSWSVFMKSVRTNNDVEGWHHGLHTRAQDKSQLPMYLLIDLLYKEAKLTSLNVHMVSEKKLRRVQRRRYRQIQAKVFSLWGQYEEGDKTARQLLKACSLLVGPRGAQNNFLS